MNLTTRVVLIVVAAGLIGAGVWLFRPTRGQETDNTKLVDSDTPAQLVGSVSCRECHQRFYELWSTSHHGLAMQPFTATFAKANLGGVEGRITIKQHTFRTQIDDKGGWVIETGPEGEKRYPMLHVLGGKNVCYFLTPLDRGRLQVLPLAFDLRKKAWFDAPASAVRHVANSDSEILPWRDPAYTFNTSCYGCHVSQLSRNYDPASDTYHTTWAEPGINCETCHGPASEHVRAAKALKPGESMDDVKLIVTKTFTPDQHNSNCGTCHAKMSPITPSFTPGERFFDHYDLVTLEDRDFYPDGRDLGENYTHTSWLINPCAQSGKLSCIHCHTSSGRYRFKEENPNGACMPCHEKQVSNPTAHTRHNADSEGSKCISCHMPMTGFARMMRSDHSMRPPTPAATIAFKSPNACNLCHTDKDAAWADQEVRQWHKEDYQAPVLHRGTLLVVARNRDWSRLPEMLQQITAADRDEVYATSFIRLLGTCEDDRKWPALRQATKDRSPLVRSAAATGLAGHPADESRDVLLAATEDPFRLVRIRAAGALAAYPRQLLTDKNRKRLDAALAELESAFTARPDDWASQYNLGSYWSERNQPARAVAAYEFATRLRPDAIPPLVNVSLIYAQAGQSARAKDVLTRALSLDPANAAANFNMGLLQAELGDTRLAESHLRAALKADPNFAEAAYNLAVLRWSQNPRETLELMQKACTLRPREPKYAYTQAFYLSESGNPAGAAELLRQLISRHPAFIDAYMLLASIHESQNQLEQARTAYRQAIDSGQLSPEERRGVEQRLNALMSRPR